MRIFLSSLVLVGTSLLVGCAPSLSPLYRDYEPRPTTPDSSLAETRRALRTAGWQLTSSSELPHTVATQDKTVQNWVLYTIDVSLEAVPMSNGKYVRLFVHPYRNFVIGGKSKLAYLPSGLRNDLIADLNDTFRKHGLKPLGTPFTRNELEQ